MAVTLQTPTSWTTTTTEAIKTGTWRTALPVYATRPSPCQVACPVDGRIAEWIELARKGRFYEAWRTLTQENPFPSVTGRVCHRPCEAACNRGEYDEALAIRRLERFVGDRALAEKRSFPAVSILHGQRVAVVGAGPSGLACAFHLRRLGYAVTVFEAQAEAGGLMRSGIPSYRLPGKVLVQEIRRLLALGIELQTNRPVDSPEAFKALREKYAAVYLAVGAARSKRLAQLDYRREWVMDGSDYLAGWSAVAGPEAGDMVVIGGGSAAMDVARTARRRGAAVRVLCLEPEELMPAQREEIEEAREEGVVILDRSMLRSVERNGVKDLTLCCVKVVFQPGPQRGDFTVEPVPGSEFLLRADRLATAIGQDPEPGVFGPQLERDESLIKADGGLQTSIPGVFAGGDAASLDRFVSHALRMGRQAALGIHAFLCADAGESPCGPAQRRLDGLVTNGGEKYGLEREAPVTLGAINTFYHPRRSRAADPRAPLPERIQGFVEVHLPLGVPAAFAEAGRCFSCGHCTLCDNCFYFCPDMAIARKAGGYAVLTDYCKGCGLCVQECPTGAVAMREEA